MINSSQSAGRAFGAENRARLLARYFEEAGAEVSPETAWKHAYRLLLWTDRTTGLAHCYESDKSQPGRKWYERSLRFHGWVAEQLGTTPNNLSREIDWFFRQASHELAEEVLRVLPKRRENVANQRRPYESLGFPDPGQDPELIAIVLEELQPWLNAEPSADALERLSQRVHEYMRLENKRKNLVGEGFEDVLAALVQRVPGTTIGQVLTRIPLHEIPGFHPPRGGDKTKKVDLALIRGPEKQRTLVTVKWSVRADREEQFQSDYAHYTRLESAGQPFDYVVITNEFDSARLRAACEKQHEGHALFSAVVHVNPEGVAAAFKGDRDIPPPIFEHIESGRLIGLEQWLRSFTSALGTSP